MKTILIVVAAALVLSACSTTEQGAGVGALAGGAIGAATTGTVAGTAVGAGIGAAAGAVIGNVAGKDNMCYYRDRQGHRYEARCPSNYRGGGY